MGGKINVIEDKSILGRSADVTLHWRGAVEDETVRARVARLPKSPGDIEAVFSPSGLNVWVRAADAPDPANIEAITIAGTRCPVRDRETTGSLGNEITRLQISE